MKKNYRILLYYCYTQIENPKEFCKQHHQFCLDNNLRGRVIIASEGLNGTLSGLKTDCETYMQNVMSNPLFAGIEFKIEAHERMAFAKLHVRVKPEIVHVGLPHINPNERTGIYVDSKKFCAILRNQPEDTVILDVRSNYEHNLGKFKNAVTLDIDNFRDFPEKVKELDDLKDKKIITYCTGGIRCEKASAFLLEQGFKNVYQLHGGIIKYGINTDGENFDGSCYVFDNRIGTEVNQANPTTISKCFVTGNPTKRMVNCANPHCNMHVPMSEEGAKVHNGNCSEACLNNPNTRPYDGTGYYQKNTNNYNPFKGLKR